MYKIAVCDDDKEFRYKVIKMINDLEMINDEMIFFEFDTGEQLLQTNEKYDVLFLEVQMPGMDGNEVSVRFRKKDENCILVFCTNYQMPLPENFKVHPFRYIMKDIRYKELLQELPDILCEMMNKAKRLYISVTKDGEVTRVSTKDIVYLTIYGRKTKIVCHNRKGTYNIFCREKLKELYLILNREEFEYVHSSYIVNLSKIIHVEGKEITLENSEKVYISRLKAKIFDEAFAKYLNRKFRR